MASSSSRFPPVARGDGGDPSIALYQAWSSREDILYPSSERLSASPEFIPLTEHYRNYHEMQKLSLGSGDSNRYKRDFIKRSGSTGSSELPPPGFAIQVNERIMTGLKGIHPTVLQFRGNHLLQDPAHKLKDDSIEKPFYGDTLKAKNKNKNKKVGGRLYLGSVCKTVKENHSIPCCQQDQHSFPPLSFQLPQEKQTNDYTVEGRIRNFLDIEHRTYLSFASSAPASKSLNRRMLRGHTVSTLPTQDHRVKVNSGLITSSPDLTSLANMGVKRGTLLQGRVHAFTLDSETQKDMDDLVVTNGMKGYRIIHEQSTKVSEKKTTSSNIDDSNDLQMKVIISRDPMKVSQGHRDFLTPRGGDWALDITEDDFDQSSIKKSSLSIASDAMHQQERESSDTSKEKQLRAYGESFKETQYLNLENSDVSAAEEVEYKPAMDDTVNEMRENPLPATQAYMDVIYEESTIPVQSESNTTFV